MKLLMFLIILSIGIIQLSCEKSKKNDGVVKNEQILNTLKPFQGQLNKDKSISQESKQNKAKNATRISRNSYPQKETAGIDHNSTKITSKINELPFDSLKTRNQIEDLQELKQTEFTNLKIEMVRIDSLIQDLTNKQEIEEKKISIFRNDSILLQNKIDIGARKSAEYKALILNKIKENTNPEEISEISKTAAQLDSETIAAHKELTEIKASINASKARVNEINDELARLKNLAQRKYEQYKTIINFLDSKIALFNIKTPQRERNKNISSRENVSASNNVKQYSATDKKLFPIETKDTTSNMGVKTSINDSVMKKIKKNSSAFGSETPLQTNDSLLLKRPLPSDSSSNISKGVLSQKDSSTVPSKKTLRKNGRKIKAKSSFWLKWIIFVLAILFILVILYLIGRNAKKKKNL